MGWPSPSLLGPGIRRPRAFPRAALLLVGTILLCSVINPAARGGTFRLIDVALKIGAAVSACFIATWAEEHLHTSQVGQSPSRRLAIGASVPVLVLMMTPPLLLVFGVSGVLTGDDGTLAVAVLAGCLWLGSAGLGSLVVLVLDVAVSALLPDLRTRFQVAVLGLLALAVAAAVLVFRAGEAVASWIETLEPSARHLEGFAELPALGFLAKPEASERLTTLFFAFAVAIALPAVLSACGKLAEMITVRLHPLQLAFRSLAQGDFDMRVEEGGSRELRELGRSFNQMAESLVEARGEVQRLNEDLENQVAARTRELRAALDELQDAQTRLVETEKQAMLSRLTAGLLHEMNSPLGALRSAIDTIRRSSERILGSLGESPPSSTTPALLRSAQASVSLTEVVVESTRRIEALMENLRRFVSLDSAEKKSCDVRGGLEVALAMAGPSFSDRIRVSRDWPDSPLMVSCYPARLNQVFLNVMQNAAAALAETDAGKLRVSATGDDDILIVIADNGPGIDERQLPHLFDFGFAKKDGGRMGLRMGLPSSKHWVEEIGGVIDVTSAPGAGTTVSIRLPRLRSPADRSAPAAVE
ncbi:MAG: HAMP domain-containing protein [Polyangiaceae bacterium]|nr:HAMP domain-containing protein [Polyangiaceae bacterium]